MELHTTPPPRGPVRYWCSAHIAQKNAPATICCGHPSQSPTPQSLAGSVHNMFLAVVALLPGTAVGLASVTLEDSSEDVWASVAAGANARRVAIERLLRRTRRMMAIPLHERRFVAGARWRHTGLQELAWQHGGCAA